MITWLYAPIVTLTYFSCSTALKKNRSAYIKHFSLSFSKEIQGAENIWSVLVSVKECLCVTKHEGLSATFLRFTDIIIFLSPCIG